MQEQSTEYVIDPATGCWVWQKGTRGGYGRVRRGERIWTAHVWYWEQAHGPVPQGLQLDHVCHSNDKSCAGGFDCPHRRCVNPDHLEPVVHSVNAQRGRLAKLTRAQVGEIKAQPWVPIGELAERYGVTRFNIIAIRTNKSWKAVPPAQGFDAPERIWDGPSAPQRITPLTEREIIEIQTAPRYYGSGRELAHKYGLSEARVSALRR